MTNNELNNHLTYVSNMELVEKRVKIVIRFYLLQVQIQNVVSFGSRLDVEISKIWE